MKNFIGFWKRFAKDESGQGMAEYILLLVIVIGVVVMFKGKFTKILQDKIGDIETGMGQVTTQ